MKGLAILACASLIASHSAGAQAIFKCKAPDGSSYFTDKACPSGSVGSLEQRASEAQYRSRVDAANPRKQREAEEAYEHNLAAGQMWEADQRAAIARRDAAISSSIDNANAQESRNRMAEAARDARFQATSVRNADLPPSYKTELQERASLYEQNAAMSQADLDEVARRARQQANSLANQSLPPSERAQLQESAGMFNQAAVTGQRVTQSDLNALDQKYQYERRTQALRAQPAIRARAPARRTW